MNLYRATYLLEGRPARTTYAGRTPEEAQHLAGKWYGESLLMVEPVVSREPKLQLSIELEPPAGRVRPTN